MGSSREIPPRDIPKSHTFVLFNLPPHPPRALCRKHFRMMFDDKELIELRALLAAGLVDPGSSRQGSILCFYAQKEVGTKKKKKEEVDRGRK